MVSIGKSIEVISLLSNYLQKSPKTRNSWRLWSVPCALFYRWLPPKISHRYWMYSSAILSFLMSIILDNFSQNSSLTLSSRLSLKMLLPSFLLMHFLSYDVASFGVYFNHGGGLFYSDACVQALGRFTVLSSVRRKQRCTQVSIGLFIYIIPVFVIIQSLVAIWQILITYNDQTNWKNRHLGWQII